MNIDPNLLQAAQRSLQRAVLWHLFDPNVSLIDLGWRILDRQGQTIEPELCVRVHVRQKLRGPDFKAFASRHPERVFDARRIGFPVDVPQANYKMQLWPITWPAPATVPPANPRDQVFNPLVGGITIFNPLRSLYGTLGGKVADRQTGREMILSNWHVLAAAWSAPPDLPIYQPHQINGRRLQEPIARLTRHAVDRHLDAAVAATTGLRPLSNEQLGLGPVTGAKTPELGLRVSKSGRGSEVTSGVITGVGGYRVRYYDGMQQVIRHIVHIAQTAEGGPVSSPGDSGSLWLEANTRQAVGLHFIGSDVPEYALALEMQPVLDALKVDLVT
ncbi:MAG: S1 family peptidase [Anaerolineae bacterium]|nr:S1 family peptidase [Anaerolineae bacterium]